MVVESTELGVDSNLEVEPMKTTKTTQDQIHTNGILTLKTKRNINKICYCVKRVVFEGVTRCCDEDFNGCLRMFRTEKLSTGLCQDCIRQKQSDENGKYIAMILPKCSMCQRHMHLSCCFYYNDKEYCDTCFESIIIPNDEEVIQQKHPYILSKKRKNNTLYHECSVVSSETLIKLS